MVLCECEPHYKWDLHRVLWLCIWSPANIAQSKVPSFWRDVLFTQSLYFSSSFSCIIIQYNNNYYYYCRCYCSFVTPFVAVTFVLRSKKNPAPLPGAEQLHNRMNRKGVSRTFTKYINHAVYMADFERACRLRLWGVECLLWYGIVTL